MKKKAPKYDNIEIQERKFDYRMMNTCIKRNPCYKFIEAAEKCYEQYKRQSKELILFKKMNTKMTRATRSTVTLKNKNSSVSQLLYQNTNQFRNSTLSIFYNLKKNRGAYS